MDERGRRQRARLELESAQTHLWVHLEVLDEWPGRVEKSERAGRGQGRSASSTPDKGSSHSSLGTVRRPRLAYECIRARLSNNKRSRKRVEGRLSPAQAHNLSPASLASSLAAGAQTLCADTREGTGAHYAIRVYKNLERRADQEHIRRPFLPLERSPERQKHNSSSAHTHTGPRSLPRPSTPSRPWRRRRASRRSA